MKDQSEFQSFDAAMTKIISVSHKELQAREKKWKDRRKRKKVVKNSLASRDPVDS